MRHIETLFCDDIREEASGKLLLIGVYSDNMLVKRFPANLPGLCISVKVVTPVDAPLSSLRIEVMLGERSLHELKVAPADLDDAARVADAMHRTGSGPQFQLGHFMIRLGPLKIEQESIVSVHAHCDGEVLYGIPLRISSTAGGH